MFVEFIGHRGVDVEALHFEQHWVAHTPGLVHSWGTHFFDVEFVAITDNRGISDHGSLESGIRLVELLIVIQHIFEAC